MTTRQIQENSEINDEWADITTRKVQPHRGWRGGGRMRRDKTTFATVNSKLATLFLKKNSILCKQSTRNKVTVHQSIYEIG
jgi:hypothetical protein